MSLAIAGLSLSKPLHRASEPLIRSIFTPIRPGKEGNSSIYLVELIRRIGSVTLCVLTAPFTVPLALFGAVLEATASIITKTPYTRLPGTAAEKEPDGNHKFMTLNACMLWGGLPIPLGGMRPPRARMEKLAEKIRDEDPDIVVMQELAFDPAHQLYGKLEDRYAHFFTRIGPNPPLMESGLFVASKYPVLDAGFIPFPKQFGIKRGAFWIETPKCFVFTTHLEFGHGREGAMKRKEQTDLIWEKIETFQKKKPCFVLGDLNMDESQYQALDLEEKFQNPYLAKHPTIDADTATCTNVINAHICGAPAPAKPFELDDYALLAKGSTERFRFDTKLVPMYDNDRPYEALSDHRGLILTAQSARSSIFG